MAAARAAARSKQVASEKPAWEGMLYEAIRIFVAGMAQLETEWDVPKLEKKLREYFNKASKHMVYRGKLSDLVNQYIDNALGSIFNALGDRDWLAQVDMLLVLDAGIKDNFPSVLFRNVTQEQFEQIVAAGYARSYEEQRFWPILTEALSAISGPNIKKKTWTAIDQSRKHTMIRAAKEGASAEEFICGWAAAAVAQLAMTSQGGPASSMPADEFVSLFTGVVGAGGLPLSVMQEGQEPPMNLVEQTIQSAYIEHTPEPPPEGEEWDPATAEAGPPTKKMKGVFGSLRHLM